MLIIGGVIFAMTVFFVLRSRQEIKATSEVLRKARAKMAAAAGAKAKPDQSATQPQKDKPKDEEAPDRGSEEDMERGL